MVRVENERIVAVGRTVDVPAGAQIIDLGNATLLPGLIDLHTHLTGDERVHWEDALVKTTPAHDALWGARNARLTLMAGFTTCRDMGPTWPFTDVALRDAINEGLVPGPRLVVAGNYVSSTGGAGDARQFSPYVDVPLVRNLADGPDEVIKAVRTNLKQGADFIKILATGAVLSKGISPGAQQYSDAEIQAAVTEARRWGRPVAAHAHGADGIKAAIRAGVRTVDHGSYLDDEAITLRPVGLYETDKGLDVVKTQREHPQADSTADGRLADAVGVEADPVEATAASMENHVSASKGSSDSVRASHDLVTRTQARWAALRGALDARRYPAAHLDALTRCLSSADVVLTKFESKPADVSVSGTARTARDAYAYYNSISSDKPLAVFSWSMAQPALRDDGSAAFEIKGKLK
jgi:hypothetical protein